MEVGTARVRLFKVGALVQSTARRVWFHLASHWPGQNLYARAATAVRQFVDQLHESWRSRGWALPPRWNAPQDRLRIAFAPTHAQITTRPTAPRSASTDVVSDGLRRHSAKSPFPPPKLAQITRDNANELTRPHHSTNSTAPP